MPPTAPFRPGIGTPAKVFSKTVRAISRAEVYFNASLARSRVILVDFSFDLIVFILREIKWKKTGDPDDWQTKIPKVQIRFSLAVPRGKFCVLHKKK